MTSDNDINTHDSAKRFGDMLKEARESAGYSLERAAMSTRISVGFIDALEKEKFNLLPGEIFGRGFLRNLCRAYGCDAKALLDAYDIATGQVSAPQEASTVEVSTPAKTPKPPKAIKVSRKLKASDIVPQDLGPLWQKAKPWAISIPIAALLVLGLRQAYQYAAKRSAEIAEKAAENQATAVAEQAPETPAAPVEAAAPAPVAAEPSATIKGEGVEAVTLTVAEPVTISFTRDKDRQLTEQFTAGVYKLQFNEQLKLYVHDTSLVDIKFKDQTIPNAKNKGEKRFMTFAVSEEAIAKKGEKVKL